MKRQYGLNRLLTNLILILVLGGIFSVIIPPIIFLASEHFGYVNYANKGEKDAQVMITKINNEKRFIVKELSPLNQYIRLKPNNEISASSMDGRTQKAAIQFVKAKAVKSDRFIQTRLGKEQIVLAFKTKATYTNRWLNQFFISPDRLMLICILMNLILLLVIWVREFSQIIRKNLAPINVAVQNIKENQLDFEVGTADIREFREILESFEELKTSLQESLERQWQSEADRRNQLSALVHDLKTPLTSVIGWTDLLGETELTPEQTAYLDQLQVSATTIESLVNALMDVTLDTKKLTVEKKDQSIEQFMDSLVKNLYPMINVKHIQFKSTLIKPSEIAQIDGNLLNQVIVNIISNAVDFVDEQGCLNLTVINNVTELRITIEDDGPGFSEALLKNAFKGSYMGDSSRSGINHFGMGLTIAKRNVDLMGGRLQLGKSVALGGAMVSIKLQNGI